MREWAGVSFWTRYRCFPQGWARPGYGVLAAKAGTHVVAECNPVRSYLWFVYLKLDVLKGPAHDVYNCAFLWVRLFYYITFSIVIKEGLWSKAFTVC